MARPSNDPQPVDVAVGMPAGWCPPSGPSAASASFRCSSVIHSVSLTADGEHLAVGLSDCTEVYQLFRSEARPDVSVEEVLPLASSSKLGDGEDGTEMEGVRTRDGGVGASPSVRRVSKHVKALASGLERSPAPSMPPIVVEPLLYLDCPAQQGGVAFSNTEGRLAVAGNQLVTVFDIISGGTICKMPRQGRVRCVALSKSGSTLVVGGFDRKATLHAICAGTELSHFRAADDVVRSVHTTADSMYMAIGSDKQGKGHVCLYDATCGHSPIAEWEHPKAVWCVRLSPDGALLAAAGYDMKMTIYCTRTRRTLHEVAYKSKAGPAFIWSMDFSADGAHLALGCWNGNAYLYHIKHADTERGRSRVSAPAPTGDDTLVQVQEIDGAPAANQAPPSVTVEEVAMVTRRDRVYAVALDADARHLCVAGRDKVCALYERTDGGLASPRRASPRGTRQPSAAGVGYALLWEAPSEDFIYTVTLSNDLRYCCYGGMNKAAIVLDGRTGVQVCRVSQPGAVWTLSLLDDSTRLAIGGELPTIKVFDLEQQRDAFQLPVNEVTYSACISQHSLAFANGQLASMYGQGGTEYGWADPPSFGVVASLILSMLSSEVCHRIPTRNPCAPLYLHVTHVDTDTLCRSAPAGGPSHTFSHLLTPSHTFSHLLTPSRSLCAGRRTCCTRRVSSSTSTPPSSMRATRRPASPSSSLSSPMPTARGSSTSSSPPSAASASRPTITVGRACTQRSSKASGTRCSSSLTRCSWSASRSSPAPCASSPNASRLLPPTTHATSYTTLATCRYRRSQRSSGTSTPLT